MEKIRVGEHLQNGFDFISKNPVLLLLGAIPSIPNFFIDPKSTSFKSIALTLCIGAVIWPYISALIMRFVCDSRQGKPSWSEINNYVLNKYLMLFAVQVIYFLASVLGCVLLILPGIFISIKLILCDGGIIFENETIAQSLRRSWDMTRGNWWRFFGLILIFSIVPMIFSLFESAMPKPVFAVLTLAVSSVFFVWYNTTLTLAYFQLRTSK